MERWSLMGEFFSLMILAIILIRYYGYEWHVAFTAKRKLFLYCLTASAAFTLLNIITVFLNDRPGSIPLWLGKFLNSSYFAVTIATCSLYALFLFRLTLEHVYDQRCIKRATAAISGLTAVYLLLVVLNLFTGILFYYDAAGRYCRGPLNRAVFLLPIVELVLLGLCYFRNRGSVSTRVIYVLRSLPPIVLILSLLQVFYPELYLNGMLSSTVSLILFISFQTHTSDRDSLTGIRNRNNFLTELNLRLAGHQPIQIILVALQSFSDLNLRYGHNTGDALLYEAARYLEYLYPQGRAFRTSSVNFALVLPWRSQEEADDALDTIFRRFQEPWVLGDFSCLLPFYMVDLRCAGSGDSPEEIIDQLEYSLNLAKKESQHLVRFDESIRRKMRQKQELIDIMQRSVKERRFRVWYQPIYCCHDDVFCSAEALLRLSDYQGNPVSPEVFIPLAEETGMISELTWIVLEEICRLLSSQRAVGLKSVSLNLSMRQLLDPELPSRIQEYLTRYQVSPDRLKLEITERLLLHDAQYAKRQLAALAAIGLEIYMDDFGTGYSNLTGVLDYPFSFIKLDRSLVLHVPGDRQAELMLRSLITMFHSLGKRLIVEGVETAQQAEYLRACGADMIQGFYYARPMPSEQLVTFLQEHAAPQIPSA